MTRRIFILFIAICFILNIAKAQSYSLESFEGSDVKINLYYKPASGALTINYDTDTLFIGNYMVAEKVKILNKVFLQIEYVKRAGSNQDFMKQLILYVHNGKLCQAFHANSLRSYDMRPSEYSLFKLKVVLASNNATTYRLVLDIHNEKKNWSNPKLNFKYDKTGFLAFAEKNGVFYSNYEYLTGYYIFHNLSGAGNRKKYLKDNIPVVSIEKDKYYYIDGNWYTKNKNVFDSMLL